MAEQLAAGIAKADPEVAVKLYNLAKTDKNDVITEIFKSKEILMESPTVNNGILVSVAALLEEMKGLKFKLKKAGTFGSYGWSGEAPKIISERLAGAGFQVIDESLRILWSPDEENNRICREYGKKFVESFFALNDTARLSIADVNRASLETCKGKGLTIAMEVEDIAGSHAFLEKSGLQPSVIRDHAWGARVFYVYDPEGNRFEFWSPKRQNSAKSPVVLMDEK